MSDNKMSRYPSRRKKNITQIIPLVLIGAGLIVIGLVTAKVISADNSSVEYSVVPSTVNFPAPELTLNDLDGQKVSISDFNGQLLLINNWATWCPPCRAEMPTLLKYYEQHSDQGFVLIGINAGDPADEISSFVNEYGLTFPILVDPNTRALIAFNNDGLPSSYVVDQQGNVVLAWTGPINRSMLEKYVTPLLRQ